MSNYASGKLKRRDLDVVCDSSFDVSLCPPATKIRRLDFNLPMIIEGQCPFTPEALEHPLLEEEMNGDMTDGVSVVTEAVLPSTLNEERGLIVYKAPENQYGVSYKINPNLISGLKNYAFWPGNPNMVSVEEVRENKRASSNCLAVVPWSPSPVPFISQVEMLVPNHEHVEEPMEAEVTATTSMEMDENGGLSINAIALGHDFLQCHPHCVIPQFPAAPAV